MALTCPVEAESHMAVLYCLSSSGALSFKSSVSMATTTLDTWLGLSEVSERAEKASHQKYTRTTQLEVCSPWASATEGKLFSCSVYHTFPCALFSLFWEIISWMALICTQYGGSILRHCIAKGNIITHILCRQYNFVMCCVKLKKNSAIKIGVLMHAIIFFSLTH